MKYVFNHYYILKHDEKRTILCSHNRTKSSIEVNQDWITFIHPVYAMILSFFSTPISLDNAIKKIAIFFDFSLDYTENLVLNFIENENIFHTFYQDAENYFPKNIIVNAVKMHDKIVKYSPQDFIYTTADLLSRRTFVSPIYVTFMLSNKCLTNCVYCYADRNTKSKELSFDKIESIIEDAAQLKLSSFDLDGGDFFLSPYWKQLLSKLQKYNYYPSIISSKYPISKQDILYFSKFNINLQISLDSIEQEILNKMVGHIPNYAKKIQQSLIDINDVMPFQVATILTKYNDSIHGLDKMYAFLSSLIKLKRWEIRVGFKSLYSKKSFEDVQINRTSISFIEDWVTQKQKISKFEIIWSPGNEIDFFKAKNGSSEFAGGLCSANSIHMFILPDGKVTICEQLYWNKNFLIGDLTKNSISEVWNSKRALYLANMKQKDHSPHSACHSCEIFDKCKANLNTCYTNILKVYGNENWDYPDPRCARAPRNISEKIYV